MATEIILAEALSFTDIRLSSPIPVNGEFQGQVHDVRTLITGEHSEGTGCSFDSPTPECGTCTRYVKV